ncbi:hypothetical protein GCM10028818_35080 [Spirosoma horti]
MHKLLVVIIGLLATVPVLAQRDTLIRISATGGLQFDQKRLILKPNTRVKLVFQNKDDMAHNLVVTRPNSRLRVVEFALALGEKGAQQHYIPVMDDVLAHTTSVEPGNTDTLTVTLAEGAYPFVCTYPGHGSIMYGVIYATSQPKRLPAPEDDLNMPNPARRVEMAHGAHKPAAPGHPYALQLPAIYRTFMPDCGPAAIAVGLPGAEGGQSYVFDAGQCRLRYAWSGGFVDNTEQWDGKGQLFTKVVGDIYFRDTSEFPWRVGDVMPKAQFKGYQLQNRYPEFRYALNGINVRERIQSVPKGRGLVRSFTISPTQQPISFIANAQPGIRIRSSVGQFQNGVLHLPKGTTQFTLTITTD